MKNKSVLNVLALGLILSACNMNGKSSNSKKKNTDEIKSISTTVGTTLQEIKLESLPVVVDGADNNILRNLDILDAQYTLSSKLGSQTARIDVAGAAESISDDGTTLVGAKISCTKALVGNYDNDQDASDVAVAFDRGDGSQYIFMTERELNNNAIIQANGVANIIVYKGKSVIIKNQDGGYFKINCL